jgi:hypothetical protein
MATKSFSINTTPHVAAIGDDLKFSFVPEVVGATFLEAYQDLREVQQRVKGKSEEDQTAEDARAASEALKEMLAHFLTEDSKQAFADNPLPDRVYVELFEWLAEIYGASGSQGNGGGGQS